MQTICMDWQCLENYQSKVSNGYKIYQNLMKAYLYFRRQRKIFT